MIIRNIFSLKNDETNETLVATVISNSHMRILEYLLENFIEYIRELYATTTARSLTHLAARHGSPELLRLLVKYDMFNAEPSNDDDRETPLHIAASHNKFNFIKEFLLQEREHRKKLSQSDELA